MKLWLDDERAPAGLSDLLAMGEAVVPEEESPGSFPPFRGTSPRLDGMNAVVAHDGEGDSDAGEKDQGRSADQERHAQEDRPEEDGCSAKACGTEEGRGDEGSGSEEDSDPEAVGNQDVRAAGCPSRSSSGAHGLRSPWGP
jgi:hypothetical protein